MNLVLEEANERLKVPLRGLSTWLWAPEVCGDWLNHITIF
jgi:hypothetical protein